MKGWIACSWDDPDFGSCTCARGIEPESIYTGRMRHGYGQYFMGTACFSWWRALPFARSEAVFFGQLGDAVGILEGALQRKPRYADREFRRFLRAYQWRVLTRGKQGAVRTGTRRSGA